MEDSIIIKQFLKESKLESIENDSTIICKEIITYINIDFNYKSILDIFQKRIEGLNFFRNFQLHLIYTLKNHSPGSDLYNAIVLSLKTAHIKK